MLEVTPKSTGNIPQFFPVDIYTSKINFNFVENLHNLL
jgi:hypothetical protein